jgi:uncharacterized membrane protein
MNSQSSNTPHDTAAGARMPESLADHIDDNVEAVVALQKREWEHVGPFQKRLEQLSRMVGRPLYSIGLICVVTGWVALNLSAVLLHRHPFDPPPFPWLDTVLTLVALLTTTVVLIGQNRQTKLELQRSHLDLQINILTEHKVTKVIHLLEELRRDLPNVRNRHDAQAAQLQERANAAHLVSALHEGGATNEEDAGD